MVQMNVYLDGSIEPTAVDVPEEFAQDQATAGRWIQNVYLPYHDSGLAAAEQDPDHPLAFLPDWAARGAYRLAQSANVVQTQLGMDAETNAKDIQDYQKYLEKVPYDDDVLKALLAMQDADSLGEFWDAASTGAGLRAIGNVVGESITQYLPVIGATLAAIPLTAGQSVTAGSVILGSISGLGSMGIEYGAAALGAMNDYLKEQGTNARDDKAVAAVLGNEEKMAEFTEFALKRGIPIGVIDGLSMGFAGKLTASLRKARKSAEEATQITKTQTPTGTTVTEIGPKVPTKTPERVALGFEALAMQPALGGLGEAVAQQVSGEGFKLGEVALETIAELPGGTAEVGIGLALEGRRERKEAELKKLKEDNRIFEERKAELLRQRKGKEEISMVEADLEKGAINPETGRPDAEQYEYVAFNFKDEPVKAGEEAFNRDSVKFWFNGEIRQPKSKNLIVDYFVRKGYMEKVKGRNQYVWTEAGEKRAKEVNEGLKITEVEETTPSEFKGTEVEEVTPSEFKGTENLEATLPDEMEAALAQRSVEELPSELVEAYNEAQEKAARVNELVEETTGRILSYTPEGKRTSGTKAAATKARNKLREVFKKLYPNADGNQQIKIYTQLQNMRLASVDDKVRVASRTDDGAVIEYTYKGYTIEKNPEGPKDAPWQLTPPGELNPSDVARTRGELIEVVDTYEASKTEAIPTPEATVTEELDITGLPTQPETTLEETQASLEGLDLEVFPTPDALPQENIEQLPLDLALEAITTNLTDETRNFIGQITPFKLRRQGADRDAIRDEFEANLEVIRVAQINAIAKTPMNLSKEETEYLQKEFEAESQFIDNIINNDIIATNDAQRDQLKEQNKQQIETLKGDQLAGTIWKQAYSLWHTTRIAEKYRIYRNYARNMLARREARERYNNIGMVLAAPLYEDISLEESKELGRMAAVLDALYGTNIDTAILNNNNTTIKDTIRITIPNEPPIPPTKEGEEEAQPIMSKERYNALLKELGVEAGKTYTLNAKLTDKFKTSQKAFKKMFDLNMVSFMNFMLQSTPLHAGIQRRYDDTVITLKEKVFESVKQYIEDINTMLLEDEKISQETINNLKNVRVDTAFVIGANDNRTTLQNILERIPKDDVNARGIVATISNQVQILKLVNDQQRVLREHPYYLPRLRYGDFFFTVRERETGEVVGYYTETPSVSNLNDKRKKQSLEEIRKKVKTLYPEKEFEVGQISRRNDDKDKTGIDATTLAKVQKLGESVGFSPFDKTSREGEMFDRINNELVTIGFGRFLAQRDENVISGYFTDDNKDHYLPIVLSNYIRSAADTASNLDYIRPINAAIRTLRKGIRDEDGNLVVEPQERLADHAEGTEKYIKNPNEPGGLFKTFAFHYALGLNFSSAFVNLSQNFTTTIPLLSMIIKDGSAVKEVIRAFRDAQKLLPKSVKELNERSATYGLDLSNPNPPKHLSRNEWNMLRKMYEEGTIQAIVNLDLGAKLQQDLGSTLKGRVSDKIARKLTKFSEFSSYMFGTVEQLNRITVALATYRLANRSKENLRRFQKFSESTLFAEEKMTPERAARMMVYKTQFLMGKENRPELFRGPLPNVATQFLSFVQQYIGLYANTMNMWFGPNRDIETRKMGARILGALMLSMWGFAGTMGWPYLENLRQLLRISSRNISSVWDREFDLEYGMKEAMNSYLNPYVTDTILHGPFSTLTGIDVRRRIGVGEPIPFGVMQGELMSATGPAGSLAVDSLSRVNQALKLGDPVMAVTSVLPLGIRAFIDAQRGLITKALPFEEPPVRTSAGRVLLPGEEIGVLDRTKQMFGFTPMKIAKARENKRVIDYLTKRSRPLQDLYLNRLAETIAAKRKAESASARRELHAELNAIRNEIKEINREALEAGRRDLIIRATPRSIRERVRVILGGQVEPLIRSARKRLGGIQRGRETLEDYVPPDFSYSDIFMSD